VETQHRRLATGSARSATTALPAKQLAVALVLITAALAVGNIATARVQSHEKAENRAEMRARSSMCHYLDSSRGSLTPLTAACTSRSYGRGMSRYIEMQHPSAIMTYNEEIHRGDDLPMIAQKGEPTFSGLRISRRSAHPTEMVLSETSKPGINSSP
jgi:hypothetical protein